MKLRLAGDLHNSGTKGLLEMLKHTQLHQERQLGIASRHLIIVQLVAT